MRITITLTDAFFYVAGFGTIIYFLVSNYRRHKAYKQFLKDREERQNRFKNQ